MNLRHLTRLMALGALVLLLLGSSGCKSKPSTIKWDQRVGFYTYEMAVDEFGRPATQAKLGDDTLVCQWLIRNRSSKTYKILYGSWMDDGHEQMDEFLTLSFGTEGKLRAWKTVYK